jgi:hypothetical protein
MLGVYVAKLWICAIDPASGSYSISLVSNSAWEVLIEVIEQLILDELGV